MKSLIECIPNVSEGRREEVVARLAESAVKAAPGVLLLDRTSDADHNRSVFTYLGDGPSLLAGCRPSSAPRSRRSTSGRTAERTPHRRRRCRSVRPGAQRHDGGLRGPREAARTAPRRALRTAGLPLRGRGHGARPAEPREHPEGRVRGARREDGGSRLEAGLRPASPHPKGGATVVGARAPLIAYNINLATEDLAVADRIAKAIRHLSGATVSSRRWG